MKFNFSLKTYIYFDLNSFLKTNILYKHKPNPVQKYFSNVKDPVGIVDNNNSSSSDKPNYLPVIYTHHNTFYKINIYIFRRLHNKCPSLIYYLLRLYVLGIKCRCKIAYQCRSSHLNKGKM